MRNIRSVVWLLLLALLPTCAKAQVSDEAKRRKLSYFYMAAQREKGQMNFPEMLEMLEHCKDIMPDDPAVTFEQGLLLYFPVGKDSIATGLMEQAVASDPANPWYLERLATIYLSRNKNAEALQILEKMAALQTKRTDVLTQLFMLYKQTGRTEDAIKALDRIQILQGKSLRIAEQKYRLYSDMGDQERAYEQVRDVCREFPYDVSCHLVMADHFMENGLMDSAMVCMERAERIDPKNGGLQLMRLRVLVESGDTLAYEQKCDSVILDNHADLDVRLAALRDVAAESLQDSVKRNRTQHLFDTLLADDNLDVNFLLLYKAYDLYLHQYQNDYINLPLQERILEKDPANFDVQAEIVQYYINQNDTKNLQRVCSNALVYFPSEVRFHYFLALTYLQEDRQVDAAETLKAAIRQADEETAPSMVGTVYGLLGDVEHMMGNEKEAFAAYDSCLVYTPDEVSCLNNYAYYLSLKGEDLERAEQMGYRAIRLEPNNKTYLDTYAWVLFMQEDYTSARLYMERVVDIKRDDQTLMEDDEVNAVLLEHAGDIYAKCEQMDVALRLWQLALQKDKKNSTLKKKIKKKKYIKK